MTIVTLKQPYKEIRKGILCILEAVNYLECKCPELMKEALDFGDEQLARKNEIEEPSQKD